MHRNVHVLHSKPATLDDFEWICIQVNLKSSGEGVSIFLLLTGQISTNTIIAESGEGSMHNLHRIVMMERNRGRQQPVSYHIEVRILPAEA